MVLGPNVIPGGQAQRSANIPQYRWDRIKHPFTFVYVTEKRTLLDCMAIMERDFDFKATHHQYVKQVARWGLPKYVTRKNSPYRASERVAQDELQTQLAPSPSNDLHTPRQLEDSRQNGTIGHVHTYDDGSGAMNAEYAAHPGQYAPSLPEAQSGPYWSYVGNSRLLMDEDVYDTAGPYPYMPPTSNVSQSGSVIPFGPHIAPRSPLQFTLQSDAAVHRPLPMPHVPYTHSGEHSHDANTPNQTWTPQEVFGPINQPGLSGSGFYNDDADADEDSHY